MLLHRLAERVKLVCMLLALTLGASAALGQATPPPAPMAPVPMPFIRNGDPFFMRADQTPQQYQIIQPVGSTTYRFVNPCSVDVRIKTVTSLADQVTTSTGTRFLARTSETLASSPPLTNPRIVSVMTLADPGPAGCITELGYGRGG